jgi:DNA-binding IclR family transcriptional regulator
VITCERARAFYVQALILRQLRFFRTALSLVDLARGVNLTRAEVKRGLAGLQRRKLVRRDAAGFRPVLRKHSARA